VSRAPWLCAAALLAGTGMRASAAQPRLTYADLARRLTDLEHLATPAQPGERCALASSYDRASRYDADTDRYLEWGANADGQGVVRREGGRIVMAELKGPGCIWRIWSASAGPGHVRIYLDGVGLPAVDLPFSGYFDGKNEPFTRPNLVYSAALGLNNYTPIPFQRSCKIVADKDWGAYYHFTYSQFPPGTLVPVFGRRLDSAGAAALDRADRILTHAGQDPAGERPGEKVEAKTVTVNPGTTAPVIELRGPRAITALRVRLDLPPDAQRRRDLLRELTLRITWDDETESSVWSPLGDFFGTAAGADRYRSLPMGLTEDGTWYSFWYMPFARRATIELGNDAPDAATVRFEITHAPLTQPAQRLARFHAKWHRNAFIPERPDRAPDWPLLVSVGRGRFVGVMLHVWNPRGDWWGEGDEKFFVDGEKFPSSIGTGSEDYFGYAWSSPRLFSRPYHGQTLSSGNKGHISVHRWHVADSVPFQSSFEGSIEKYQFDRYPTQYAAVAYWYLEAGGRDPYAPVAAVAERRDYFAQPHVYSEPGVLEGEGLKVLKASTGGQGQQSMFVFGEKTWSGDSQLFWQPDRKGARLELELPVDKGGRYRLLARFTKSFDYGVFQPWLDGRKLGPPLDLDSGGGVKAAEPLELAGLSLDAGPHALAFTAVGTNSGGYYFGLDYLKLVPAE